MEGEVTEKLAWIIGRRRRGRRKWMKERRRRKSGGVEGAGRGGGLQHCCSESEPRAHTVTWKKEMIMSGSQTQPHTESSLTNKQQRPLLLFMERQDYHLIFQMHLSHSIRIYQFVIS